MMGIFKDLLSSDEMEQAFVRIIMGLCVFNYIVFPDYSVIIDIFTQFNTVPGIITLSFVYLSATIILFVVFKISSINHVFLRRAAVFVDIATLSCGIILATEIVLPIFFIYLWIIIGYGLRYGLKDLYVTVGFSITGFSIAIFIGEFNSTQTKIAFGNLLSLVLIPGYIYVLLKKLQTKNIKLVEATALADQANEAKTKFLANMSHELRTPLNGVIGSCEFLEETRLNDEQRKFVHIANDSAHMLLGLINNILDISKIEANKISLERHNFNVETLADEVVGIIQPLADKKGLIIKKNIMCTMPLNVVGDPTRIKQVLINLGNNAVKFTNEGQVTFNIYEKYNDPGEVKLVFEVIDTGIGIPKNQHDHIFERFKQTDDSITRKYGGTGLGVSISKQLVEMMGGTIGLISEPDHGSRFWFEITLPKQQEIFNKSNDLTVLTFSNNKKYISIISELLSQWDVTHIVVDDKTALQNKLKELFVMVKHIKVIVDDSSLDDHPDTFLNTIEYKDERKTAFILAKHDCNIDDFEVKNYDYIIDIPINSRQLYQAVHQNEKDQREGNIITSINSRSHITTNTERTLEILVAEDQETNQFIITRILESLEHKVTMMSNGQTALDALTENNYDLAILDLQMPELSGLEVIKMYKFIKPTSKLPFIIVTADARRETLDEIKEHVDGYLTKPIIKAKLAKIINNIFNNKQRQDKLSTISSYEDGSVLFNIDELNITYDDEMLTGSFMEELIEQFLVNARQIIQNLNDSIDANDTQVFKEHAHALKGIAGNLYAQKLQSMAKHCQDMDNDEYNIKASQIITEMNQCLHETYNEMKNYINKNRSSNK